MKNTLIRLLLTGLFIGFLFTGCKKDDDFNPDGGPEDKLIQIDENQAFNMKNFIISFDQLFNSDERWMWGIVHDYKNGKAITSVQGYKIYGKLGNAVFEINHTYNNDGVVISSERTSLFSDQRKGEDSPLVFNYEYDLDGFIVKLFKIREADTLDVVVMEYDNKNQLIKKTHEAEPHKGGAGEKIETFSYDSDGNVVEYIEGNEKKLYEYSGGNMVKESHYYNDVLEYVSNYEYDSKGRVIKEYEDGDDEYTTIEYGEEIVTVSSYEDNLLRNVEEVNFGLVFLKSYEYEYGEGDVFEYCRAKESDEDGNTSKKYYYEGTVDNLVLVGYSEIDSRETGCDKKTKESVYDASGALLYYAEFTVDGCSITATSWFNASGTGIDPETISEDWVFILIR